MKQIKVGFIGSGGFTRKFHMVNAKENTKLTIHAMMDVLEETAKSAAEEFGAAYHTTDLDRLLSDGDIDLVIIATPHNTHAELCMKAANAGKHILCEKPMALTWYDCRSIAEAVKKNNVKYTIGYNRGMAPLILEARKRLDSVPAKRMIYHRIQAYFSPGHWTHDPEIGGGRIVSEGCHIFDLLSELVPAPPVCVYASGSRFLPPEMSKMLDSAIVTITYADGSVGTTLIASAGCKTFPKEATEIYADQHAISISNFVEMECHGFAEEKEVMTLPAVDKGHKLELDLLAEAILEDKDPPNNLQKAARAAYISYCAMESLDSGKAVPLKESDYAV